jgi:hypothetical protein
MTKTAETAPMIIAAIASLLAILADFSPSTCLPAEKWLVAYR